MRIALIGDASPLTPADPIAGGGNVFIAEVARHLCGLGHDVDVFAHREDPSLPDEVTTAEGVRVMHVDAEPASFSSSERPPPWIAPFGASVERIARSRRYHVVHATAWASAIAGMRVQRSLGTPLVVTPGALQPIDDRSVGWEASKIDVIRAADHVVTECPQSRRAVLGRWGADPSRVSIVPTGFDPGAFFPGSRYTARHRIGIPLGGPLIVHVGRFASDTASDDAVRAASAVLSRKRHARMIVVGGYPGDEASMAERARIEQLARELEVWRQVAFAGSVPRDRRRDFYLAADVVVSTMWDHSSLTTGIESMACGTPVIAPDVDDVRSTVHDKVTGFLVPPHATDAIVERLLDGFADRPRLRRMGREAARQVRSGLTWRRITEQLVAVYATALAERRGAAFEAAAAV